MTHWLVYIGFRHSLNKAGANLIIITGILPLRLPLRQDPGQDQNDKQSKALVISPLRSLRGFSFRRRSPYLDLSMRGGIHLPSVISAWGQ